MVTINPRRIPGRWRIGVALDLHTLSSEFRGHDEYGNPQFDTRRSEIGEMLYLLKYSSKFDLIDEIASAAASFVQGLRKPPYSFNPDLVVPVPPSRQRSRQPVLELAVAIAAKLGISAVPDAVTRIKQIPELKAIHEYDERLSALNDAHAINNAATSGKSVLLFDDLFRSGASMNAVAGVLMDQGGVVDICALSITQTRSNR